MCRERLLYHAAFLTMHLVSKSAPPARLTPLRRLFVLIGVFRDGIEQQRSESL